MADTDNMPSTVETAPNMDTTTTFLGIEAKQLGAGGGIVMIGALIGLSLENMWFVLPFGILGLIVTFYSKEDLPIWEYGWRWLQYNLIEANFLEGCEDCSGHLLNIRRLEGNYYQVSRNKYIAVMLVEGAPYDNLSINEKKNLLSTFRAMLNSSSFDFPIQIIGKKGPVPMGLIHPAPGLHAEESKYNEPLEYIGKELENYLAELGNSISSYYYHIVIPYRSTDEGSEEYQEEQIENTLDNRVRLISQYLTGMNLGHRRLEGEELINTLVAFVDKENPMEEE